jgi:hypothetical protein
MWKVKATVIPVTTGSAAFRQYLSNVMGKHEIKELPNAYWSLHTYFGQYQCGSTKHM